MGGETKQYLKITLITIIALVLVIIIAVIVYYWTIENQPPAETVKKIAKDIDNTIKGTEYGPGEQEEIEYLEKITESEESSSSSSSGGGGGSGSSSSSSGGASTCTNELLIYGLLNLEKEETCNNWDNSICIDKTIQCQIEVHNFDKKSLGYFNLRLSFMPKGGNKSIDIFDTTDKSLEINASSFELFSGQTKITSTGVDGLANKDINCYYNTISEPYKVVC